jgi:gliding motility-associated lipoprotein GldD
MKESNRIFCFFIVAALVFTSCNSNYTLNKKRGYYKIDFPEREYVSFDKPGYPYSFEFPAYANVVKDSTFFEATPENDYWINIDFPRFGGRIYISYKYIRKNNFDSLIQDAYTMSYKQHTQLASSIEPTLIRTKNNIDGVYFTLTGNTATANQFFLTDSVRHFLRGALYFDAAPNEDSLSVVNDFLKQDMQHLINTLRYFPFRLFTSLSIYFSSNGARENIFVRTRLFFFAVSIFFPFSFSFNDTSGSISITPSCSISTTALFSLRMGSSSFGAVITALRMVLFRSAVGFSTTVSLTGSATILAETDPLEGDSS